MPVGKPAALASKGQLIIYCGPIVAVLGSPIEHIDQTGIGIHRFGLPCHGTLCKTLAGRPAPSVRTSRTGRSPARTDCGIPTSGICSMIMGRKVGDRARPGTPFRMTRAAGNILYAQDFSGGSWRRYEHIAN